MAAVEQKTEPNKLLRVALAGNPNSGKTTLFNALTGSRYKVANYPGVTVERREALASLTGFGPCLFVDLPGLYSLTGSSPDEHIAMELLAGTIHAREHPDLVVAVVDSTNLQRNLYLVSQLLDCGLPLVVALTMTDVAARRGLEIDAAQLALFLDAPVVKVYAKKKIGLDDLRSAIGEKLKSHRASRYQMAWLLGQSEFRRSLQQISQTLRREDASESQKLFISGALLSGVLSHDNSAFAKSVTFDFSTETWAAVAAQREQLRHAGIDPDAYEAGKRFQWIRSIGERIQKPAAATERSWQERLDNWATHRIWGTLIFLLVMGALFHSVFSLAALPMDLIDSGVGALGALLTEWLPAGVLRSLLVEGIVAGVGSVLVFIPQIALLLFLLSLLEDSGYLMRASYLMDRIMRLFGLQGRSFVPLLNCFACTVPGIMTTRSIPSRADRIATILVAPLMSCGAKLVIYTVLIAAFIPRTLVGGFVSLQALVLMAIYLLGVLGAGVFAWLLKRSVLAGESSYLVLELPDYRRPSLRVALRQAWDRVLIFIKSAGTVILAASIVLWFLASYPRPADPDTPPKVALEQSYAGRLGRSLEPIIQPLGYSWEMGVGLIASFAARELFISTLATMYSIEGAAGSSESLTRVLKQKRAQGHFTLPKALSLVIFFVFSCQCVSTLAVAARESGSWRWALFMFTYLTVTAYVAAWATYRVSSWALGY